MNLTRAYDITPWSADSRAETRANYAKADVMADTSIGSVKVDVVPDFEQWNAVTRMAGLRTIQTVLYEYDGDGLVIKQTTTTEQGKVDS